MTDEQFSSDADRADEMEARWRRACQNLANNQATLQDLLDTLNSMMTACSSLVIGVDEHKLITEGEEITLRTWSGEYKLSEMIEPISDIIDKMREN